MKSRICSTPFSIPARISHQPKESHLLARRQRNLLLGVSLLLILCWVLASIWLISMRREARRLAEVGREQEIIALLFPAEEAISR